MFTRLRTWFPFLVNPLFPEPWRHPPPKLLQLGRAAA